MSCSCRHNSACSRCRVGLTFPAPTGPTMASIRLDMSHSKLMFFRVSLPFCASRRGAGTLTGHAPHTAVQPACVVSHLPIPSSRQAFHCNARGVLLLEGLCPSHSGTILIGSGTQQATLPREGSECWSAVVPSLLGRVRQVLHQDILQGGTQRRRADHSISRGQTSCTAYVYSSRHTVDE